MLKTTDPNTPLPKLLAQLDEDGSAVAASTNAGARDKARARAVPASRKTGPQ